MGGMAISEGLYLDKIVPRILNTGRSRILTVAIAATAATAVADWKMGSLSLASAYIFPMLLAATVLSPRSIVAFAFACAFLRCCFDDSQSALQYAVHFSGSALSYIISGLFVVAVVRNREMALRHVTQITREQRLRNDAQERLKNLVESSPAAILTLNQEGIVIASNHAADGLLGIGNGQTLTGRSIKPFMPVLSEALRLGIGREPFRAATQTQGRRKNGEIFLADLWFSTYFAGDGTHLAAIVVDSSEEMRNREELNMQQLTRNSRLMVAAVLHEIRNLCGAISVVYSNLKERSEPCRVEDIRGLETLVTALGHVASVESYDRGQQPADEVALQQVLDDLRIIIEPAWQEIGGSVSWNMPESGLRVLANRYSLMQVFMNLAQNSHRAVQSGAAPSLSIAVVRQAGRVCVSFRDTGPGIKDTKHLFQPFQQGAQNVGLGLFISRAILRSFGGELRYEPVDRGCCFVVDLPVGAGKANV